MGVRCGAEELNHSGNDDFSVVDVMVGLYHDGAFGGVGGVVSAGSGIVVESGG